MSKKRATESNLGQVGALVPSLVAQACPGDRECNVVGRLVDQLHECALKKLRSPKASSKTAWKQWSPTGHGERASDTALTKAAYTCVLTLKCGSVCILRVDRGGNCSFVVRLKRSHWDHLAKAEGLTEWSDRVFYHPLQREEGVALLLGARAFKVAKDCVHHPHALSLLCGMGRVGCLSKQCSGTVAKAGLKASASFELVALPPSPMVVEECFCLLGHKATFKQQQAVGDSDEEADDVPLSQHVVDASIWGATYGTTICDARDADRFKEAGQLVKANNVAATLQHLPALNTHFAHSAETLATLANSHQAWQAEQDEHADLLAPSDAEDSPGPSSASRATKAAKEPKAAEPKPSARRQQQQQSRGEKRARTSRPQKKNKDEEEEEEGEEENESEASSVHASSENPTSDEDDDDDDDDDDLDGRRKQRRPRKAAKAVASDEEEEAPEEAAPAAAPVAAGLPVEALKAMCQPCCAQLTRFLLANDGLITGTRWERLEDDHRLLHEATTVETVVAASLSLARTLMDAHTDPPEEATVLVSGRERARVRALAAKTAAFATAALDDVDRAIAESRAHTEHLESLRKRGYDALEAVEGGGFGNKDEGAPCL